MKGMYMQYEGTSVQGEHVDNLGNISADKMLPIHRSAPAFSQLETRPSIFETETKVVDPLAPYRRVEKYASSVGQE